MRPDPRQTYPRLVSNLSAGGETRVLQRMRNSSQAMDILPVELSNRFLSINNAKHKEHEEKTDEFDNLINCSMTEFLAL